MKKKKEYVIFDLEATCYNRGDNKPDGFKNEIIEIGAIKLDELGNEIDRFSKFAKPKLFPFISDFCNELTTIKQEDIDNADPLRTVLIDFMEWAIDADLISWGYYDAKQLISDLSINDIDDEKYKLKIENNHYSLKHLYAAWNGLRRKGIGMKKALNIENIKLSGTHHRGIDDAENIVKIFKKYINKYKSYHE